ncbi:MAG: hypothetical protein J07HN6_02436 [Halonotius sp. J07HN6]|jgi:hypothetical protein|nr:MAG: hypothetical protein J07HN6_02436 [Halonotius sp. J07HN6]
MAAAVPDPPDDWTVSTTTETHLALYYAADGRSLVVRPAEPPASNGWTVKGLAGYEPPYPIFADGVDRAEAIDAAWNVMKTVAAGETVSPVQTESAADSDIGGDTESERGTEDNEGDTAADEIDQADLTAFADEE